MELTETKTEPLVGKNFPKLSIETTSGERLKLPEDWHGKWTVVYFYPKDDTPGCTKQACGYNDHHAQFKKLGAQIFGVSLDDKKSHEKFIKKYELGFELLLDEDRKLSEALGVYGDKSFMGRIFKGLSRDTFLVDPSGKIVEVWRKVSPGTTVQITLDAIKSRL